MSSACHNEYAPQALILSWLDGDGVDVKESLRFHVGRISWAFLNKNRCNMNTNDWVARLQVGSTFISIYGETSDTEDGQDIFTGPFVVGTVLAIDETTTDAQFSVVFPKGVTGFLSEAELRNPREGYVPSPDSGVTTLSAADVMILIRLNLLGMDGEALAEAGTSQLNYPVSYAGDGVFKQEGFDDFQAGDIIESIIASVEGDTGEEIAKFHNEHCGTVIEYRGDSVWELRTPIVDQHYYCWKHQVITEEGELRWSNIGDPMVDEVDISELMFSTVEEAVEAVVSGSWGVTPEDAADYLLLEVQAKVVLNPFAKKTEGIANV
jgi:hypothetical protein